MADILEFPLKQQEPEAVTEPHSGEQHEIFVAFLKAVVGTTSNYTHLSSLVEKAIEVCERVIPDVALPGVNKTFLNAGRLVAGQYRKTIELAKEEIPQAIGIGPTMSPKCSMEEDEGEALNQLYAAHEKFRKKRNAFVFERTGELLSENEKFLSSFETVAEGLLHTAVQLRIIPEKRGNQLQRELKSGMLSYAYKKGCSF